MSRLFRGTVRVTITGAEPLRSLNSFSAAAITFWKAEQIDELHLRCMIFRRDLKAAERAALRAMCTLEAEAFFGFRARFYGLRRRPVLVIGVVLAVVLALFAQNIIWIVRVEGNTTLTEAQIVHALAEEGIGFGSWGFAADDELLRDRLQLRLPQLIWAGANRSGGVLTVLVSEREQAPVHVDWSGPANVCAARDGVVTSVSALNGKAAVQPGEAVLAGQLLISGITSWENRSQITHAAGEVYALTRRQIRVLSPTQCLEKRYTGEVTREVTLIVGRKRRKIFGNSRISAADCDKMVRTEVCTLPGGEETPLRLEIVTYRYYETVPVTPEPAQVQPRMEEAAAQLARRSMIAGAILNASYTMTKEEGCCVLEAELSCQEMISVTVPIRIIPEEAPLGEADQRGTD